MGRRKITRRKVTRRKVTRRKNTLRKNTLKYKRNKRSYRRRKRNKRGGSSEGTIEPVEETAEISVGEDEVTYKKCPLCGKQSRLGWGRTDSHKPSCIFRKSADELNRNGLETGFDEKRNVFYVRKTSGGGAAAAFLELAEKAGMNPLDVAKIGGVQKAIDKIELQKLSPPRAIQTIRDEGGSYTIVDFNGKRFAAYEGDPPSFLEGVKYTDQVTWYGFPEVLAKASKWLAISHDKTRDIFIAAAEENTLEAWESRGIPPIFLVRSGSDWIVSADGTHRINSVIQAAKKLGKSHEAMGIPVTFQDGNEWREPGPVYYSVNKSVFDETDLLKIKRALEL